MNDLISKLLKLKTAAKIGVTAGLVVVIAGLYYSLLFSDLNDQITSAETRQTQLKTEKLSYEKRKLEYVAYRNELTQLQQEQRDLLKALPKNAEIPSFMANIQEQADLAGLEVLNFNNDAEIPEELYVRIPIRWEVRGSYHALTKFFKNVSEMTRIVNIENLHMVVERTSNDPDALGAARLKAKFVANTFRYRDKEGGT